MTPVGRFAPSPSGYLHPGNLLCALLAWLSCRSRGGRFLLRIEDLDPMRCPRDQALSAMDDLRWLGLLWDEEPLWQSERTEVYAAYARRLSEMGLTYPCFCSRRERHASFAPNRGDELPVYSGRCRGLSPEEAAALALRRRSALRVRVPAVDVAFTDGVMGPYRQNLARECGDFIIRRSDGLYAYPLAVVADDAESGVTEVVRGADILPATPQQIWLQETLGLPTPRYLHIPLLTDASGRRLSKRDGDVSLKALSRRFSREEILGMLACAAGQIESPRPVTLDALLAGFSWEKVPKSDVRLPIPSGEPDVR